MIVDLNAVMSIIVNVPAAIVSTVRLPRIDPLSILLPIRSQLLGLCAGYTITHPKAQRSLCEFNSRSSRPVDDRFEVLLKDRPLPSGVVTDNVPWLSIRKRRVFTSK